MSGAPPDTSPVQLQETGAIGKHADIHHSQSKKEFMGVPGFVVDFMSTFLSDFRFGAAMSH